ncbi:MAG: hypothetical protein ACOC2M_00220 [bacterium]
MKKNDLIKIATELDRVMGMEPAPPLDGKTSDLKFWLMTTLPYVRKDDQDEFDTDVFDFLDMDDFKEVIEKELENEKLVEFVIKELSQGGDEIEEEQYRNDVARGLSFILNTLIQPEKAPETEPEKETKPKKKKPKEESVKETQEKEGVNLTKDNLYLALDIVSPGLDKKDYIDQATSFVFKDGRVITFNNEISISHPILGLKVQGAVKADELYKLLSKIKSDDLFINQSENELLIKSGRTTAGIRKESKITMPLDAIEDKEEWHDLPEDFAFYLNLAMSSCGNDFRTEPILTNVNVTSEGRVTGSDGFRLMACDIGSPMPVDDFLISSTASQYVSQMDPTKISRSEKWVHFKNDTGTEISCRILNAKYPEIKNILKVEGITVELPENMNEILQRTSVFSKRSNIHEEKIEITLKKGELVVYADNEYGWVKESADVEYDDSEITFAIAPYLFKDILKETNQFILGENALKFQGAGWEYITGLKS